MKRKQLIQETKQKISLRSYYKKQHSIKVNQKIMESLTVNEFEEYLKRRHQEARKRKATIILRTHLISYIFKRRFKKRLKKRKEAAIIIQNWYRKYWNDVSFAKKKKRLEASKIVQAH